MSRMYHALLNLQQRPRPQPPARRPQERPAGVLAPAATPQAPAPASDEQADASHAAQGALERATRLLQAHHELPEPLAAPRFDTPAPATHTPQPPLGLPPLAATLAAAGFAPSASVRAAPGEAMQRLLRLLGDPLRSRPLLALAERLACDRQAHGCRSQWLVAVGPSQGVEEVALGVAACLAESSDLAAGSVLLVDADLGRRRLSQALGCGDQPGLAECLLGGMPASGLCRPTGLAHLSFLPAGQTASGRLLEGIAGTLATAAGGLGASGWQALVSSFGVVLLGGGTTEDPWAGALAQLAEATYVVVELGCIDESTARAVVDRLRQQGARVLGCIATGA